MLKKLQQKLIDLRLQVNNTKEPQSTISVIENKLKKIETTSQIPTRSTIKEADVVLSTTTQQSLSTIEEVFFNLKLMF